MTKRLEASSTDRNEVPTLSDGSPSTLATYRKWANLLFGDKAVAFIDQKIAESPNGENEVVIAHESQMLILLAELSK